MKNWKVCLIVTIGILAVIIMCVCGVQNSQNHAISLEEQVGSAKSDVNVQEKRRADLIVNLVDCVKQYDEHEYETLLKVVEARNSNSDQDIDEVKNAINVAVEAYPELKSNDNYKQLMTELATTENLIANYRENFNKQIKEYNRYIRKFPTRLFLSITGYESQDYQYLDYGNNVDAPKNLFD